MCECECEWECEWKKGKKDSYWSRVHTHTSFHCDSACGKTSVLLIALVEIVYWRIAELVCMRWRAHVCALLVDIININSSAVCEEAMPAAAVCPYHHTCSRLRNRIIVLHRRACMCVRVYVCSACSYTTHKHTRCINRTAYHHHKWKAMPYSRSTNYSFKRALVWFPLLFSRSSDTPLHLCYDAHFFVYASCTAYECATIFGGYLFSYRIWRAFNQLSIALSIYIILASGMVECIRSHNSFMDKVQCTLCAAHTHVCHSYAHANT